MDDTTQDRNCTYNDYFRAGLGPSVYSSLGGTVDGETCAVHKLDPVYQILDGYSREIRDTLNSCDLTTIAQDGLDVLLRKVC